MLKGLTAALTVAGLSGGVLMAATPAGASARHEWHKVSTVSMHASGGAVTLSRHSVHAGRVRFVVDTTSADGSNVLVFRPARGVSLATVFADFGDEFSSDPQVAAKGTRELTRDARFFGGADVMPGVGAVVTENLHPARYYVVDVAAPPGPNGPMLSMLNVKGHDDESSGRLGRKSPVVRMTSDDRFLVRGHLHARGTVLVHNVSDTIHFMELQPVKAGTTDAQIQAFFDSGDQGQPSFAVNGPSTGMEVLSPGHEAALTYKLPKGTYVLLCFVADDMTGMPHAVMGMHKVVVLK